jgi:hypothetical protein
LIAINARFAGPCLLHTEGEVAMFKANVGTTDRILRIVVGVILIALVFTGPMTLWGWIGVIPLVTGLFGTCPVYSLIGVSSCKRS